MRARVILAFDQIDRDDRSTADVRFGSKADMCRVQGDVR